MQIEFYIHEALHFTKELLQVEFYMEFTRELLSKTLVIKGNILLRV